MPQPKPQLIPFPASGLHEDAGFDNQPPLTTNLIENVRAHDSIKGRIRGGRRPALSKFHSIAINGTNSIQHILKVTRPVVYPDILGPYLVAFDSIASNRFSGALASDGSSTFSYNTGDGAYGIARDANGDYYICGLRTNTWAGNDGSSKTVWKVSAAGTVLWTFDTGTTAGDDLAYDLAYDATNDRLYVVGIRTSDWAGAGGNASLWRLNPATGAVVWAVDLGNTMRAVKVDSNGNIFVCGTRNNSWAGATQQANVWKINSSGTILAVYLTTVGGFRTVRTMDIDPLDRIWIVQDSPTTDWEGNDGSSKDIFLLDNALTTPVSSFLSSASPTVSVIRSMANGAFVIHDTGSTPVATRKYNASGVVQWSFTPSTNIAQIAVTVDDNVLILTEQNTDWTGSTGTASLFLLDGSTGAVILDAIAATPSDAPERESDIFAVGVGVDPLSTREASLISVSGGTIKKLLAGVLTTPTNGASALTNKDYRINAVQLSQTIFYVDGTNSKFYDLVTNIVSDWASNMNAGSLPTLTRLIARYRGRVVLSGKQSDPANWFMSKAGDGKDFDFTPAVTTAIQAVAGNASEVGLVGDVVTALMPFNDDAMLIGGDQSIWQMSGDPAAGGSIDLVTDKIGVAWNSWTQGPFGEIYFLGNDGVYRIERGQLPVKITANKLDERFRQIDLASVRCLMAWDIIRHGLVITLAVPGTSLQTSYFWNSRVDGWSVDTYPVAFGPSYLYAYDSERASDTEFLLGCKDSFIRQVDDTAINDDGTSISSKVRYQPIALTDGRGDGILQGVAITLAVGSGAVTLKVYTGQTAEECMTSTAVRFARTLKTGRNPIGNQNIRGKYVQIELESTVNARWAVESVFLTIRPSGGGREKRA